MVACNRSYFPRGDFFAPPTLFFSARLTDAIFLLLSHPTREDVRSYGRFFCSTSVPQLFRVAGQCDFFASVGWSDFACAATLREKIELLPPCEFPGA